MRCLDGAIFQPSVIVSNLYRRLPCALCLPEHTRRRYSPRPFSVKAFPANRGPMIPSSASKRQWSAGGVVLACRRIWCQGFLMAKNFSIRKLMQLKCHERLSKKISCKSYRIAFFKPSESGGADYRAEFQKALSQHLADFFPRANHEVGSGLKKARFFKKMWEQFP